MYRKLLLLLDVAVLVFFVYMAIISLPFSGEDIWFDLTLDFAIPIFLILNIVYIVFPTTTQKLKMSRRMKSELAILFCVLAFIGAIWKLDPVLNFSDIMLGLMVVPNLIAVIALLPVVRKETKVYFEKLKQGKFKKFK